VVNITAAILLVAVKDKPALVFEYLKFGADCAFSASLLAR